METIAKISKTERLFFATINKTEKPLARLFRERKKKKE